MTQTQNRHQFKKGDVVAYKDPLPDEDPNQTYIVLEYKEDGDRSRCDITPVGWKGNLPPIFTNLSSELKLQP